MLPGYNLYDMYGIYWHKRSLKLMEDGVVKKAVYMALK